MKFAAFLRGMNVGRRRITNDELCACFEAMGLVGVGAFLASGNVAFESRDSDPATVAKRIETGLREALEYEVPTFVRTAAEVRSIAEAEPFSEEEKANSEGKLQVTMLAEAPGNRARGEVLALATAQDRLAIEGRELYWLPVGRLTDSELDFRFIQKTLGPTTTRTQRTLERMAKKFF